jgi:hypothetical protein
MKFKLQHAVILPMFLAAGMAGTSSCTNDGALEEAGEDVDEALEDTGEAIEDAAEEVEDEVEDDK